MGGSLSPFFFGGLAIRIEQIYNSLRSMLLPFLTLWIVTPSTFFGF